MNIYLYIHTRMHRYIQCIYVVPLHLEACIKHKKDEYLFIVVAFTEQLFFTATAENSFHNMKT